MSIFLTILGIVSVVVWVFANLYTAKMYNAKEMRQEFINGQCLVGKIFANIFYAPAWLFKVVRLVVVATIK